MALNLRLRQIGFHHFLEYIDNRFIERYGGAFENIDQIQNQSLFKVTDKNGSVVLVLVEV